MLNLGKRLEQFKKVIVEKESYDKKFQTDVALAINEIFVSEIVYKKFIKDVYLKHQTLILVSLNKAFSNELFLRRELFMSKIRQNYPKIKELMIK